MENERPGCLGALLEGAVRAAVDLVVALVGNLLRAPLRLVTPPGMIVRRAEAAEVVDLRHRVLRAGQPRETAIFDRDDAPDTRHWVAEEGGRVVGVATVIAWPMGGPTGDEGPRWMLRGMAVDPGRQRAGVGAELLAGVAQEVGAPMWCNARVSAAGFYERHGWKAVGPDFEKEGIGPHRKMTWSP